MKWLLVLTSVLFLAIVANADGHSLNRHVNQSVFEIHVNMTGPIPPSTVRMFVVKTGVLVTLTYEADLFFADPPAEGSLLYIGPFPVELWPSPVLVDLTSDLLAFLSYNFDINPELVPQFSFNGFSEYMIAHLNARFDRTTGCFVVTAANGEPFANYGGTEFYMIGLLGGQVTYMTNTTALPPSV